MIELWQKVLLWIVLFIDVFVFVKLSQLKIAGIPIIRLYWRILIAVLFPLIFLFFFVFGAVLIGFVLAALFVILIFSLFKKKKIIKIRFF